MRACVAGWLSACVLVGATAAQGHPLEKGLTVSDPRVTLELEKRGYGFRDLVKPRIDENKECPVKPGAGQIRNLFRHPPLCDVAERLAARVKAAQTLTLDPTAKSEGDAGTRFPTDFFRDDGATLTLVGVVNRMDRAYRPIRDPGEKRADVCGEVRFIYRFGYREKFKDEFIASRLPLTLNLVMRARRAGQAENCAAIAQRWIDFAQQQPDDVTSSDAAAAQIAEAFKNGPLALLSADHIDRLELNMQIMRLPASSKEDFGTHAEYLLKVFNWDVKRKVFVEAFLENQIDANLNVDNRKKNPGVFRTTLARFKKTVLSDAMLFDLDRGQIVIPEEFLASNAVSVAPGGESRSQNGPFNALLGSEKQCKDNPADFICKAELDQLLASYKARKGELKNVKTTAGLITRFNDVSCSGCHQTRAIAGFHFTGADLISDNAFAPNTVFVPASPQFFGDQPRRRRILDEIASGADLNKVDFSRGFSARPEPRFADKLENTTLFNGWGAACHLDAGKPKGDRSFAGWTCGANLKCAPYMQTGDSRRGICVAASPQIGDPLETGKVTSTRFGADAYARLEPNTVKAFSHEDTSLNVVDGKTLSQRLNLPERPDAVGYVASQQLFFEKRSSGGFPGGMLRLQCCKDLPDQATCGKVAVDGFNTCLGDKSKPFTACFRDNVNYAALRACDVANPCREDYICLQSLLGANTIDADYNALTPLEREYHCDKPDKSWLLRARKGVCIPPYFVLQFRADKHHVINGNPSGK